MKRTILFLLLALLIASPALAGPKVSLYTIADGSTAVAAGHAYSPTDSAYYDLDPQIQGYFALALSISGDGTAKVEYQMTPDGTNYVEPLNEAEIFTGITSGSGWVYKQFDPAFGRKMRIVITETGGVNTITPTCYLLMK